MTDKTPQLLPRQKAEEHMLDAERGWLESLTREQLVNRLLGIEKSHVQAMSPSELHQRLIGTTAGQFGLEPNPCVYCGGRGCYEITTPPPYSTRTITCPRCKGTGKA